MKKMKGWEAKMTGRIFKFKNEEGRRGVGKLLGKSGKSGEDDLEEVQSSFLF